MTKCFSFTASRNWCLRTTFSSSGLRSTITDLGDGTVIHCWIPKTHKPTRPDLLLLHGFGANAMWQWGPEIIPRFVKHFNVYVPDLVFFGDSYSTRPDRSESFQAESIYKAIKKLMNNMVRKMRVVGLSYGGFVAYRMAVEYIDIVERVVICCAGVSLEERDLENGLFPVKSLEEAAEMLLPQTPEKMKELMRFTFVKPPVKTPNCILVDFIDEMNKENVAEKKELVHALAKDRKFSELPKIPQPTLIIWGDKDQVFPMELGYRLKRHLGDNADMVVLKDTGHAYIAEKPKEFYKHLKSFLLPQVPPLPSSTTPTLTPTSTPTPTTPTDTFSVNTTSTTTTPTNTIATTNHHNPLHFQNNGSVTVTT
uniref:pimeloyl-[acyl-carrier protein] methyl ester esterase-like n=1 Tax=Erigeron canadensis TaxID=72917 RepID=UPI001CB8BDBD|nr:pimeloyl-[acyl-carrier protein] methyl ester esterase-like [Erigeron canadensis]